MVTAIQAKVLLSTVRPTDTWFGLRYNMNLYRGCQHQCIYCDSRSECYQIEDFTDIQVKVNALDLLRQELARKRVKGTIGTGSMNDPYMPIEAQRSMTGRALEIIAQQRFGVHVITKSDLVLRDIAALRAISPVYAAVSFTVTTADDALSRQVEPGAPPTSRRFQAMAALASEGILTGVTMMPILPLIEDDEQNIAAIVAQAHAAGARYIVAAFGMTMRDRQRAYYYGKLDQLFPGLRQEYERRYGERYSCPSPHAARLERLFHELCARYGIATRMPFYQPATAEQRRLF
jgi:DNA repair photolyase